MSLFDLIKERLVDPFGLVSVGPPVAEEVVWGFTLEQLRALPAGQIRDLVTARLQQLDEKEMIELLLQIVNVNRKPEIAYRPDGQIESRLDVEEDAVGKKVGSTLIAWSYYPTNEVDEIVISERDANDVETTRRTIKHYLDGRQPTQLIT